MSKEISRVNDRKEPASTVKAEKAEDVVFLKPNKPATMQEVIDEAKKQGLRPLTIEEARALEKQTVDAIKPEDTDLAVEYHEVDSEQKQLPKN